MYIYIHIFGGTWTTQSANIKHTVDFILNQSRPDVNI